MRTTVSVAASCSICPLRISKVRRPQPCADTSFGLPAWARQPTGTPPARPGYSDARDNNMIDPLPFFAQTLIRAGVRSDRTPPGLVFRPTLGYAFRAARQALGAVPYSRAKARENAASEAYPTDLPIEPTGSDVVASRSA